MTLPFRYGIAVSLLWKPISDVLQRWRICLASLVFFTIFLTNNFGLSTGSVGHQSQHTTTYAPSGPPPGSSQITGGVQKPLHDYTQHGYYINNHRTSGSGRDSESSPVSSASSSKYASDYSHPHPYHHRRTTSHVSSQSTWSTEGTGGSDLDPVRGPHLDPDPPDLPPDRAQQHTSSDSISSSSSPSSSSVPSSPGSVVHIDLSNVVPSSSRNHVTRGPNQQLSSAAPRGNIKSLSSVLMSKSSSSRDLSSSASRLSLTSGYLSQSSSDLRKSTASSPRPSGGSSNDKYNSSPARSKPRSHLSARITPNTNDPETHHTNPSQQSHNAGTSQTSKQPNVHPNHVGTRATPSSSASSSSSSARARKRHISVQRASRNSGSLRAPRTPNQACKNSYGEVMRNNSALKSQQQCLLNEDFADMVCTLPADWERSCPRSQRMREIYLKFCGEYPLYNTFLHHNKKCFLDEQSEAKCREILNDVVLKDNEAKEMYSLFETVASKFDCKDADSTEWSCALCKAAYKSWMCSQVIPYYDADKKLDPCPVYCDLVETHCPYIKPHLLDMYAGEQVFTCRDWDDIPHQYLASTDEWVDEPRKVCIPCHQQCRTSRNTTAICRAQMEKYQNPSDTDPDIAYLDHDTPCSNSEDRSVTSSSASNDLLTPGSDKGKQNDNATQSEVSSSADVTRGTWITLLCATISTHYVFVYCSSVPSIFIVASHHRIIGLT